MLGCAWYGYSDWYRVDYPEMSWVPGQSLVNEGDFFLDYSISFKFCVSFYTSVLALCGNDIYPVEVPWQYLIGCLYLLMGALMQAYMFGNLAVMVQ